MRSNAAALYLDLGDATTAGPLHTRALQIYELTFLLLAIPYSPIV
jgi:hypothetical protein